MYLLILFLFLIGIAVYDTITFRIPDILLILLLILICFAESFKTDDVYILRLITGSFILILFTAIWHFTQGIGLGDVKYAAVLGFAFGLENVFIVFLLSAMLGLLVYILGIYAFKWSKNTRIPYAPFLSAGAVLAAGGIF